MSGRINLQGNTNQLQTLEQVLINPLNNSKSKMQYSFSKAPRFRISKSELRDYKFYELPSTKEKKGCAFGTAARRTFTEDSGHLPPNKYVYAADGQFGFDKSNKNKHGVVFAVGRQHMKTNNFMEIGSISPGPGKYKQVNPELIQHRITGQISFPRSPKFMSLRKIELAAVGPGSYHIKSPINYENRFLSEQTKLPCPKIAENKTKSRKIHTQTNAPLYAPKVTHKGDKIDLIDPEKGCKIGNSKRYDFAGKGLAPGPGRYKAFSQFLSKGK